VGDNDKTTGKGAERSSRGSFDFSSYSLEQLAQLRDTLNSEAAPELHAALTAELSSREDSHSTKDGIPAWSGRYSTSNGISGWLATRLRGQPVYGNGFLRIESKSLQLGGRQRTWLGVPLDRVLELPLDRVRNVARVGSRLQFEVRRSAWSPRRISFEPEDLEDLGSIVAHLPELTTRRFETGGRELLAFEQELHSRCPLAWVTTALVLFNVAAFIALVIAAGTLSGLTFSPVLFKFANVPGLVAGGDWWRLASALFVHASLLHLLLNMWALWSIGRLTERLFGQARFAAIYLFAGVFGGLAGIAWDPSRWSVGASGAVFGVMGAFLVCLARSSTHVPRSVMRAHWLPTLLFVAFNLLSGTFQPDTDNAAHFGGLLAGAALGLALLPVRTQGLQARVGTMRVAAIGVLLALTGIALWQSGSLMRPMALPERFMARNAWYTDGEARNGITWQRLAAQSAAGYTSDAQLADQFEKQILPFWTQAHGRLLAESRKLESADREYQEAVANYALKRRDWVESIVDLASDRDPGRAERTEKRALEVQKSAARLERLALLSNAANQKSGLRQLDSVARFRGVFSRDGDECIRSPYVNVIKVAPEDSRVDGPALRDAAACKAQQLFTAGNFQALETSLREGLARRGDLPDGGSTFSGIERGLSLYFQFGTASTLANLSRLASWRRAVPDSPFVGEVEAQIFQAWAWQARGGGYAKEISGQAWQAFAHRTEMAAASLEASRSSAAENPIWYHTSVDVALDQAEERPTKLAVLKEGVAAHPDDRELYRSYLRTLMPRWGGSFEEVVDFINGVANAAPANQQDELYAELFWAYADMESEQANVFKDVGASWERFQRGLASLMEAHKQSDFLLNAFARFACEADAPLAYQVVREEIATRPSATAWTLETTRAGCEKKFAQRP
jgi:membrane associated rhomboid family serine protease